MANSNINNLAQVNQKLTNISDKEFGQNGCDLINDTNAHADFWVAIKADGAADAVFTTLTTSKGDDLDGLTLKAGDVIYGPFTNITLTSGTIYAYRKFDRG